KRLFTFLRKPCSTSTEIRVRLRRNTHDALYADSFGMTLKYWPNRKEMPNLVSEFAYPVPKT
ncbi:hypothetical protein DEE80_25655, partial [Burkholderia contaminans]|uniref:hypothetical protein n=2 Tax=Burkholderia contaminans TaxID=488447 RepID=UPI001C721D8F